MKTMNRCAWVDSSDLYTKYHDTEWGIPSYDDNHLFEMLILEGAQAGLNWTTILKKRDTYREAYYGFDPERIAKFTKKKKEQLLRNPGIVRNRLKVDASVQNAKVFVDIQSKEGSFSEFIWSFVAGKPIINKWRNVNEIPAETVESQAMSKTLKKKGFRFVGPTICYAFMQAVGMVNDHEIGCFRYKKLAQ